jgi:hypothetical protein
MLKLYYSYTLAIDIYIDRSFCVVQWTMFGKAVTLLHLIDLFM